MHPANKILKEASVARGFVRTLTLSAVLGTVGVSTAHAGDYTIHGSSCAFLNNDQKGVSHVETGIYAQAISQVTCPLIRLDRQDNQLARVEVDYRTGPDGGSGGNCRVFAISDMGDVTFGPALNFDTTPNQNGWITFFGTSQTPVAQNIFSTYAVDCFLPKDANISGLVVTE